MLRKPLPLVLVLALTLQLSNPLLSQAEVPRVPALVLDGQIHKAPELDGVLDDACWRVAKPATDLRQVFPREGGTPQDITEVRFAHDHKHLYIAIRCDDREPGRITARELQRDSFEGESFPADDFVQIVIDPFGRQRDGFLFAVNPLGAMTDGRIENSTTTVVEWDGIWDARARRDANGWTAEMKIPFSTLSFDPARDSWGVNIQRLIRRREEMIRWAQPTQSRDGDWLTDIGRLDGMTELDQGLGLELKPYIVLRHTDSNADGSSTELRGGFDASWLITPALTATITVNTDFAEAEADVRQVNLSRFPLFFPEKRDFFLRDAPYFSFPTNTSLLTPFFSRTIGRGADGTPVDIMAGAKFTGRAGPYTLGILDVQQDGHDGLPDKNLLVARVTRELSEETTLGMLLTHGDPYQAGDNTLFGGDLTWRTSRFFGDKNLNTTLWGLGSDDDQSGRDAAFGWSAGYSNQPWDIFAAASQIGDDFNPALGFLERQGVREYVLDTVYRYEVNGSWLRSFNIRVAPYLVTDLDDRLESAKHVLPGLRWELESGDEFAFWLNHKEEQLFEPFDIRPGNLIEPDDYKFHSVEGEFLGAPSRMLAPSAGFEVGDFYNGQLRSFWTQIDFRPSPHVFAGIGYEQYGVELPGGDFTSRFLTVRLNLAVSPRLSWNTLAQYDNESDTFGVNSRIRWTVRPGTDVYFIVNQGYAVQDRRRLKYVQSEAALKAGMTWRF